MRHERVQKRLSLILLVGTIVGLGTMLGGCWLIRLGGTSRGLESAQRLQGWNGGTYRGPECAEVLCISAHTCPRGEDPPADRAERVLMLVCERQEGGLREGPHRVIAATERASHSFPNLAESWRTFDDRHYRHLDAALIATEAHLTGVRRMRFSSAERTGALARLFAELVDPAQLRLELASLDPRVPPAAQEELVGLVGRIVAGEASRPGDPLALVGAVMEPADEARWHLDYEVPREVLLARRAHFQKFARFYGALDGWRAQVELEVRAGQPRPETAQSLEAMRRDFLEACDEKCLEAPLMGEVGLLLAKLHVAAGNMLDAKAELGTYRIGDRYRVSWAQAVTVARAEEAEAMAERKEAYDRLVERGVDPSVARRRVGGAVGEVRLDRGSLFHVEARIPDLTEGLPTGGVAPFSGEVRSVRNARGGLEILFKRETRTGWVSTNCRNTNRVERITSDGRVLYEQECQQRRTRHTVEDAPPVVVPASDARGIRRGDVAQGFSLDGRGRVVTVKRHDRMVRWLGHDLR